MKHELCEAFCNDITVAPVPAGLAVGTAFSRDDGDRVSFYVVENEEGSIILEDDGTTLAYLADAGVDFETDTRRRALDALLTSVDAYFDENDATIRTHAFTRADVGKRSINFVGALLRMNDFLLLTQEKVSSTFREDAAARIKEAAGDQAVVRENVYVSGKLKETKPDMVIEAEHRSVVAVFFGNTPRRVDDAIFLHFSAMYEAQTDLAVIALLENDNSISQELRRRASNRLAAVPVFQHDEEAAVARIMREATGHRLN